MPDPETTSGLSLPSELRLVLRLCSTYWAEVAVMGIGLALDWATPNILARGLTSTGAHSAGSTGSQPDV